MNLLPSLLILLSMLSTPLPEPTETPVQVDLQLRLIQFTPEPGKVPLLGDIPVLGNLMGENPEGEALAGIPGVTMNVPVSDLFVDKDHYTLTCRATDIDTLLQNASRSAPGMKFLTAPRLLVLAGQQASVKVGQPVHYLQRNEDGCLEAVSDPDVREGIEVELLVGKATADRIAFSQIEVQLNEVLSREALADIPFDLGRPTIATRRTRMKLDLKPNQVGVFPIPRVGDDDLPVLLFLTARIAPDQTGNATGGR